MKKIRIGIDINETLRARWSQFDRFFVEEFGEDGIPDEPYVFDLFNDYPWKDTIEVIKELKEPEDIPDDINPKHYQTNDKGEANADYLLFKKEEKKKLTAKEMYNRFMYEDFVFEIHGTAPLMYGGMDLDLKKFYLKYRNCVDFTLLSQENVFSIPSTLSFLSKMTSRFNNYRFVENKKDMWKDIDLLITTDPEILEKGSPFLKKIIKVRRPYNENIKVGSIQILQIADLINNKQFEKIIKFKNNK